MLSMDLGAYPAWTRHLPDTRRPLAVENDVVGAPARAQRVRRVAQRHRRPAAQRHLLELPTSIEPDPLAVWRDERTPALLRARNGRRLKLIQVTQIELIVGPVDELRAVEGKRHEMAADERETLVGAKRDRETRHRLSGRRVGPRQAPPGKAREEDGEHDNAKSGHGSLPDLKRWSDGKFSWRAGRCLECALHRQPDGRNVAHPLFGIFLQADLDRLTDPRRHVAVQGGPGGHVVVADRRSGCESHRSVSVSAVPRRRSPCRLRR